MSDQTVTLLATMEARPDRANEMRAALRDASEASRAEDGCLLYELLESDRNGTFLVVEKWRDKDSFRAHQSSVHLAETAQRLGPLLAKAPEFVPWRSVD